MEDKNKKENTWIFIASVVFVICIPFVNGSRENIGSNDYIENIYGFPFDWLHTYPNNGYNFLGIGFIGNILFFYFGIKFLIWIYKKIVGWFTTLTK